MKRIISVMLIGSLLITMCPMGFAGEYIIGPYDILEISVLNHSELAAKATITPDGQISLPLLGFVEVQGKTLRGLDAFLTERYSAYIQDPHLVINLTPKPIYIIQYDRKKMDWDVRTAKSIDEARAYANDPVSGVSVAGVPVGANGGSPSTIAHDGSPSAIVHGGVYKVNSGKEPDWWEDNWYKVLTATAVVVGVISTTRKW